MKRILSNVIVTIILISIFSNSIVCCAESKEKYYNVQIPIFQGTTEEFHTELLNGIMTAKEEEKGIIFVSIEELNSEDNVKPTENSQKETGTVKIGDGYLNVRESPSMSGKIIGKLYNGDKVTIEETSEDGKWLKISKSDIKGYVSSNYVSKNGEKSKITMEDLRKGVKCFISKNWKSNIYYKIPSNFCYEENDCFYGEIRTEDNNSPVAGWFEVNKNTGISKISMPDGTETTFNIKDYL